MQTLPEIVADRTQRARLVTDTVQLIDAEVQRKGGLTGMALKTGYAVVSRLQGGKMIERAVNMLLPEFAVAIEPLHASFRASGSHGPFRDFLAQRPAEATNALLAITDEKARQTDNSVLKKTYEKLRPTAVKHVQEALPGLGDLVDRHTRG